MRDAGSGGSRVARQDVEKSAKTNGAPFTAACLCGSLHVRVAGRRPAVANARPRATSATSANSARDRDALRAAPATHYISGSDKVVLDYRKSVALTIRPHVVCVRP